MLYSLAIALIVFLGLPFWLLHAKTRPGFLARFGFYPDRRFPRGAPRIWLHGASAGDLLSLSPMIGLLRQRFPGCSIVLSTFTNSGHQMAQKRIEGVDAITFMPWDLPFATRRAVAAIEPDLLVLEYTEVWPNLIRAAHRHGARIALTNGRFSPKHLSSYRRLFALSGHPLRDIDLFLMREEDEADRVLQLGARRERVVVTGNTKFDALVPVPDDPAADEALREALGFPEGAPILVAGSTHEGEEPLLLDAFRRLLDAHPALRLAIAPRYVERAAKIAVLAEAAGFAPRLRSAPDPKARPRDARVAIIDTIGELPRAYHLADLVFVGGSFTQRGGQNILEPAAQGKPVLFGPNMDNFRDSVRLLVGRGGIQLNDAEHLLRVADELLSQPEKMRELGALACQTVTSIRGASARNVDRMAQLLGPDGQDGARRAVS